jgi:hypothetical protein
MALANADCAGCLRDAAASVEESSPPNIRSARILPVCAQPPVIAFPERLRVHVRMQPGSRNRASRLMRWRW